mgnify:CR=1 FL=1
MSDEFNYYMTKDDRRAHYPYLIHRRGCGHWDIAKNNPKWDCIHLCWDTVGDDDRIHTDLQNLLKDWYEGFVGEVIDEDEYPNPPMTLKEAQEMADSAALTIRFAPCAKKGASQ